MWNYLYFIAYLRFKREDDYTGIESYIALQLEKNELEWLTFDRLIIKLKNLIFIELRKLVKKRKKMLRISNYYLLNKMLRKI